jgi:uncharacterized protein
MRVIADANVLVSAALTRSPQAPSALILDAALTGRIELITSPHLLQEIAMVLTRPRLRKYLSNQEAQRFITDLAAQTNLIADPPGPHPALCRDPHDDYLLPWPQPATPTFSSPATSTCSRSTPASSPSRSSPQGNSSTASGDDRFVLTVRRSDRATSRPQHLNGAPTHQRRNTTAPGKTQTPGLKIQLEAGSLPAVSIGRRLRVRRISSASSPKAPATLTIRNHRPSRQPPPSKLASSSSRVRSRAVLAHPACAITKHLGFCRGCTFRVNCSRCRRGARGLVKRAWQRDGVVGCRESRLGPELERGSTAPSRRG